MEPEPDLHTGSDLKYRYRLRPKVPAPQHRIHANGGRNWFFFILASSKLTAVTIYNKDNFSSGSRSQLISAPPAHCFFLSFSWWQQTPQKKIYDDLLKYRENTCTGTKNKTITLRHLAYTPSSTQDADAVRRRWKMDLDVWQRGGSSEKPN